MFAAIRSAYASVVEQLQGYAGDVREIRQRLRACHGLEPLDGPLPAVNVLPPARAAEVPQPAASPAEKPGAAAEAGGRRGKAAK
jgi:hypothetical protein